MTVWIRRNRRVTVSAGCRRGRPAWRWASHCVGPARCAGSEEPAPSGSRTGCRAQRTRSRCWSCWWRSVSPRHPPWERQRQIRLDPEQKVQRRLHHRYWTGDLHHGAGVAARLAAVSDQEGSVSLPAEQRLGLKAVDVSQPPQTLVVVRKVLLILHHAVLTEGGDTSTINVPAGTVTAQPEVLFCSVLFCVSGLSGAAGWITRPQLKGRVQHVFTNKFMFYSSLL